MGRNVDGWQLSLDVERQSMEKIGIKYRPNYPPIPYYLFSPHLLTDLHFSQIFIPFASYLRKTGNTPKKPQLHPKNGLLDKTWPADACIRLWGGVRVWANNGNCGGRGVCQCGEGTFLNKEERKRQGRIPSENNDGKIHPNYPLSKNCSQQHKKYATRKGQISAPHSQALIHTLPMDPQPKNQEQVQQELFSARRKLDRGTLYNILKNSNSTPMYYYYTLPFPQPPAGLLPLTLLPPYPYLPFPDWSLPLPDSLPNRVQNSRKESQSSHLTSPGPVQPHTAHRSSRKQVGEEEQDGTDAFTEKRNIIPNNINHILAYVQRKSKSEPVITRIIAHLKTQHPSQEGNFTPRRFYAYQSYLKGKIDIHVSKKTLILVSSNLDLHSDIFTPEEQLFYNRVCRAAIVHYLRCVAALTTLNSRRLRETSKKDHLCAQRHLLQFMKNIQDQQILQA